MQELSKTPFFFLKNLIHYSPKFQKIMKKLIFTPIILFLFFAVSFAQPFQAHVEGDTKIEGKLDVTDANTNTFIGGSAGISNTSGINNVALGSLALTSNSSGFQNTATGTLALRTNTSGQCNTASGYQSLFLNGGGIGNSAAGCQSLYLNTSGNFNTASGYQSLFNNRGSSNTALGASALGVNTTGSNNTAVGAQAGPALGQTTLTNASAFGYQANNTASNQVKLGNAAVTSICGAVPFTAVSDGRFKENIQEDVKGLDFVLNLRPVTYDLNTGNIQNFIDGKGKQSPLETGQRQTGFIAQEVDQLAKEMGIAFSGVDAPQNEKSHYGLRYATFVVPLVKAVQEQQALIEDLRNQVKNKDAEMTELSEKYDALEGKVEQLVELLDAKL